MRRGNASLASVVAVMVLLTACGANESQGSVAQEGGASGLTGSGTGANCSIEQAVPIGAVLSLTGPAASYGESQRKGLELAAKELTEGVTYELTIEDDATDPKQGIAIFERFIGDDVSS